MHIRLPCESVGCLTFVVGEKGLRPLGVIHRIGEKLAFQTHCAGFAIGSAALAGATDTAGVKLQAGAVGADRHGATGVGIMKHGAGIRIYHKIVVISLEKSPNILLECFGSSEIHGRTLHTLQLPGGETHPVGGGVGFCRYGENLLHSQFRTVVTG